MDILDHSTVITSPNNIENLQCRRKIQLAVMASGQGSNFQALAKASKIGKLSAEIKVLITNTKDCGAIAKAKSMNIPYVYLDHRKYDRREDYEKLIIDTLNNYEVEAIAMAGWMRVVTSTLINGFPGRIVNIHPSLLPSFKGVNAIRQALDSGSKITGCTVHIVNKEVDSGKILIQSATSINENETEETLKLKIQELEHQIFYKGIMLAAVAWRRN